MQVQERLRVEGEWTASVIEELCAQEEKWSGEKRGKRSITTV